MTHIITTAKAAMIGALLFNPLAQVGARMLRGNGDSSKSLTKRSSASPLYLPQSKLKSAVNNVATATDYSAIRAGLSKNQPSESIYSSPLSAPAPGSTSALLDNNNTIKNIAYQIINELSKEFGGEIPLEEIFTSKPSNLLEIISKSIQKNPNRLQEFVRRLEIDTKNAYKQLSLEDAVLKEGAIRRLMEQLRPLIPQATMLRQINDLVMAYPNIPFDRIFPTAKTNGAFTQLPVQEFNQLAKDLSKHRAHFFNLVRTLRNDLSSTKESIKKLNKELNTLNKMDVNFSTKKESILIKKENALDKKLALQTILQPLKLLKNKMLREINNHLKPLLTQMPDLVTAIMTIKKFENQKILLDKFHEFQPKEKPLNLQNISTQLDVALKDIAPNSAPWLKDFFSINHKDLEQILRHQEKLLPNSPSGNKILDEASDLRGLLRLALQENRQKQPRETKYSEEQLVFMEDLVQILDSKIQNAAEMLAANNYYKHIGVDKPTKNQAA